MSISIRELEPIMLREAVKLRDHVFTGLDKSDQETLHASLFPDEYTGWYAENEIDRVSYWIALDEQENEIAGLAGLYTQKTDTEDMVWLGWFCVDPGYRGKKIGAMLLEFAIDQARAQNKRFLHLYTSDLAEYATARKLYDKYGFVKYDVDDDLWYYKLDLNTSTAT